MEITKCSFSSNLNIFVLSVLAKQSVDARNSGMVQQTGWVKLEIPLVESHTDKTLQHKIVALNQKLFVEVSLHSTNRNNPLNLQSLRTYLFDVQPSQPHLVGEQDCEEYYEIDVQVTRCSNPLTIRHIPDRLRELSALRRCSAQLLLPTVPGESASLREGQHRHRLAQVLLQPARVCYSMGAFSL